MGSQKPNSVLFLSFLQQEGETVINSCKFTLIRSYLYKKEKRNKQTPVKVGFLTPVGLGAVGMERQSDPQLLAGNKLAVCLLHPSTG